MKQKIVITEYGGKIVTALLEDEKIVELDFAKPAERFSVGDIYIGKVVRLLKTGGAFIDIGGMDCFLNAPKGKEIRCGMEIPVQIRKEGTHIKQPLVTTNLNFQGTFAVVTTENHLVGISGKLPKSEKERLTPLAAPALDAGFGVVFRTNCQYAEDEEIRAEIAKLVDTCKGVTDIANARTCHSLLFKAPSAFISDIKGLSLAEDAEIVADKTVCGGALYDEIYRYLSEERPDDLKLLRGYEDTSYSLVNCYSIMTETERALKNRVEMRSGAFLVIESTEALHVIDVNSGRSGKNMNEVKKVNLEAAKEAARQIRLRNLSGIIVIDFINMKTKEEDEELMQYLAKELRADRNPGKVVDMTALGLIEVTRKKTRKTLREAYYEQ